METEEDRQLRWKARIEEMKKEKRRTELLHRCIMFSVAALAIAFGCCLGIGGSVFLHRDAPKDEYGNIQQGEDISGVGEKVMADGSKHSQGGTGSASVDGTIPDTEGEGQLAGTPQDEGEGQSDGTPQDGGEGQSDGTPQDGGEGQSGGTPQDEGEGQSGGTPQDGGEGQSDGTPQDGGESQSGGTPQDEGEGQPESIPADGILPVVNQAVPSSVPVFEAYSTPDTVRFQDSIISQYGVFISVEDGVILAQKDAGARMNPASMTKILTVLVAAEHISEADLENTVSITLDITDYCYIHGCSVTGYSLDETVTVKDLFYGTVLPSGADSALALADYVAGSHEAFVGLMNEKLEELGLSESSHFTNCVGLYDENHYSTAYDIAVILKTAADNEFCKNVLSAHTYTTSATKQHPEGLSVSNWFLRRIEDRDTHGEVLCAKTGFVNQSGSCAASLCAGNDGKEYLCVTAGSSDSWKCIADQVELYQRFIPE